MRDGAHADPGRGVAVVLVRNAVDHDSRVLREARTLTALGLETTVLGVVSFTQRREVSEQDGFTVRRLTPGSRLAWVVFREISILRPGRRAAAGAPPAGGPGDGHATAPPGDTHAPGAPLGGALAGFRSTARRLLRWATTLGYYARATRVVHSLRPDLVHCNDYNTMWIGVAARLLCGSALIYDSHELWADRNLRGEPRWWLVMCEALFVRAADRVVTTSPAYAEELSRRYRIPRPAVVRNIPERRGSGDSLPADRWDGDRLVVYLGGLQPGRGIEQSIRALPLVDATRLRLIGPGAPEYRARLRALVSSMSLDDRVEFREPVPPEELLEAVSGAAVGLALIEPVCLSYRLTLPNKLFEYALAGLPVLGSDLPMIARFVTDHGLGRTVDPKDVEAIGAALRDMLSPERNRRFRQAAAHSASSLDWRSEREVLERCYRQSLAERGRDALVAPGGAGPGS